MKNIKVWESTQVASPWGSLDNPVVVGAAVTGDIIGAGVGGGVGGSVAIVGNIIEAGVGGNVATIGRIVGIDVRAGVAGIQDEDCSLFSKWMLTNIVRQCCK
jgi:hypothetical protein